MEHARASLRRCAVYTRKSSEEGLEQDFNSLAAQREACDAFIRSQAGEGWRLVKTGYDDGGLSGATMERPALTRLLADIRERLIDVVVVYKVDRLTRSLADFAKMVEVFDARGVSFVAVTQQFNTITSMGRLTLNVLLSFAQFEREVTGERIRDKIAASKAKGMWMGGTVPLGYDFRDRRLVVNQAEAATVREIYARYLELGSVRLLKQELDRRGVLSKRRVSKDGRQSGGWPFARGALYELLANPLYLGEIRHRKTRHPGQHEAIVERGLWEQVQRRLRERAVRHGARSTGTAPSPLAGKLFDENGEPLYACGASKGARRYRYYVSRKLIQSSSAGQAGGGGWRLSAPQLEQSVAAAARRMLRDRAEIAAVLHEAGASAEEIQSALRALAAQAERWQSDSQAMAEVAALSDRVELSKGGIQLSLNLRALWPEGSIGAAELSMTRFIALQMRRRGVETKLVIEGEASETGRDPALLKAVALGHRWFRELASGTMPTTIAIARRERVRDNYVRRLLPLAFLAPPIVEAICAGRQPPELTAERLRRRAGLPLDWQTQLSWLCLAPRAPEAGSQNS